MGLQVDTNSIPQALMQLVNRAHAPDNNGAYPPFTFKGVEVKHAVELLRSRLPDFSRDAYSYISVVYNHLLLVEANPYLSFRPIANDSDLKRRLSEDFGAGLGSLFMVKTFGVRWESVEQVPRRGGSQPDLRGDGPNGRFVYEAKGATSRQTQRSQQTKGKQQKGKYVGSVAGKLVVSSYFHTGNGGDRSELALADPPFDFDIEALFSRQATLDFERTHFKRTAAYAVGRGRAQAIMRNPDRTDQYLDRWLMEAEEPLERREIDGKTFVGKSARAEEEASRGFLQLPSELHNLSTFRGIQENVLIRGAAQIKMQESPYPFHERESTLRTSREEATSILSDGSILIMSLEE